MTCPVHSTTALIGADESDAGPVTRGDVIDQFDDVLGSLLTGLFAVALYDQTMVPEISAALEATGRIRDNPVMRAARTAASEQLSLIGADPDRAREMQRLVRLHQDVRGVSTDGVRYSALTPELWNWVLLSTFMMNRGAFLALTGTRLTDTDEQAIWDHFCTLTSGLQLSGQSRLPARYSEARAFYDQMAAERLTSTTTLEHAYNHIRRPARPSFLPSVIGPLWDHAAAPALGHVFLVLGTGTMHAGVREVMPFEWTWRHDAEFRALTLVLRCAYRWLPTGLTDSPLARNRRAYRKLVARFEGMGLSTFVPDHTR